MPSFSQMTQAGANDPLGGGLGARKPRPDEIAKRDAEITAKQAAERRAHDFEKIVHATEKQMRDETLGRASGSAPLGNSGNSGAGQKLDERGYLVQAADRIWPNDFKREIADQGCDLLGVFNDHFGVNLDLESLQSLARMNKMGPREFLTEMSHRETLGMRVWFDLPLGRKAFLRKVTAS